jgi:hypothetical protein
MDSKKVAVVGICWIISGLLAIFVGAYMNAQQLPVVNCPNIPSYPTKAQVLAYINATEEGDTGCSITALDLYGQGVLDAYNVSLNLTDLGTPYTTTSNGTVYMVIGAIAVIAGIWIVLVRNKIVKMTRVRSFKARASGRGRR